MKMIQFPMKLPELPPGFGLRWQAKRDTALVRTWEFSSASRRAKAPSPLRSAGAVQTGNRGGLTLLH